MIKAVIFDVDGTLVDSVDAHAKSWRAALADSGHEIPYPEVRMQIGKGGDQLLKEFLSESEIEAKGDQIEEKRKQIFRSSYLDGIVGFPAVADLFKRLTTDGILIALASSAAADELDIYKNKAGIADLVREETSKDEVRQSKPHPDIFAAAMDKLGNPSLNHVFVIGDSPWDAIAARKLGLRCIGLRCGGFPEDALRSSGCAEIFDDPHDLLVHYAQIFQQA
ncbi:MAG TPA: HAD family hydrolase [Chthoniobacterales bacterium]